MLQLRDSRQSFVEERGETTMTVQELATRFPEIPKDLLDELSFRSLPESAEGLLIMRPPLRAEPEPCSSAL